MVSLAAPDADLPPPRTTGCIGRHRDSKGNKDDGETSSRRGAQAVSNRIFGVGLGWLHRVESRDFTKSVLCTDVPSPSAFLRRRWLIKPRLILQIAGERL